MYVNFFTNIFFQFYLIEIYTYYFLFVSAYVYLRFLRFGNIWTRTIEYSNLNF